MCFHNLRTARGGNRFKENIAIKNKNIASLDTSERCYVGRQTIFKKYVFGFFIIFLLQLFTLLSSRKTSRTIESKLSLLHIECDLSYKQNEDKF